MNLASIRLITLPFVLGALLSSVGVTALPTDKEETIRGSADKLTVDQKNGVATYSGSVIIQQGSLVISADRIVVHSLPDNSVEKIVASGSPARFQQQPEPDQGLVTASAKQITYTPASQRLLLVEDASVEQNGAVMSGPRIDYDLVKEVMRAAGSTSSGGATQRIEIVIPPRGEGDATIQLTPAEPAPLSSEQAPSTPEPNNEESR